MSEILRFLVEYLSWLYTDCDFRIIDSESSKSFGGNGVVVLESEDLRIRLIRDHEKLFLEFQGRHEWPDNDWSSFDIIRQFITGEVLDKSSVDEQAAAFLLNHVDDILSSFSNLNSVSTRNRFRELEGERGRRLFG